MASCSGIGIKEIGSTRVYLEGTITGIDSSKRYCLHHYWSGWQNLPRSGRDYTYISGVTSFDLGSAGCYVPKDKTVEGQQFEVRLHEVERTCESIIREACSKILWYEVTEQRYVHFYVRDDNRDPVNNARIECAGETVYTGSDGKTYLILDTEATYYARGYAPSGYECTDCYESFYHDSDRVVNFWMEKIPETVIIDVHVVDQNSVPVADSQVTIPNALGATTIATNTSGVAVGFTLTKGATFTATAAPPTGYTSDSGSAVSFTATQTGIIDLTLTKEPITGTLAIGSTPHGARIYVDDVYRGITPNPASPAGEYYYLTLPAGTYNIKLTLDGYEDATITALVEGGRTTYYSPVLEALLIVCIPSVQAFSAPDKITIDMSDPAVPPTFPDTFVISVNMVAPCVPAGSLPVNLFPMVLNLMIDEGVRDYTEAVTTDSSGAYSQDIAGIFRRWLAAKSTAELEELLTLPGITLILKHYGKVEFENLTAEGIWSEFTTGATQWISLDLLPPLPIICRPSIPSLSSPELTLEPPSVVGGLPTFGSLSGPVEFAVSSMDCSRGDAPLPDEFPFYADFRLAGILMSDQVQVNRGGNTIPVAQLTALINLAIAAGSITLDTSSAPIQLTYPSEITDGVVTGITELNGTIGIAEIPDIFCDLSVSASDPGVIPFEIPLYGGIPTLSVPIPITAMFRAVCDDGVLADRLTFIDAEVFVNDIPFGTIRPDITGRTDFDLATDLTWLTTIHLGDPTMVLKIRFPRQLKCSTPTPVGTQEYTKEISIDVTVEEPECVLDATDYYTCPDGTVLQINECVNNVKVPIVPTPTCPEIPPECVLDATDFYTCPDGTVLQLNECVNNVKVPIVPIPTCPEPEAIVCIITNVVEVVPLNVTISEFGILTVDRCDIDVQLYKDCDKSMAEILAVTGGFLNLNYADGTRFASIPLDIYGEGVLDIAPYALSWLLSLTEIPATLDLVLVCPSKVTFSTPTVEYEEVPVTIGIQVTGPPAPPECVLDATDYYTCPDGTVIQLNECVNGVKVPIVPAPTCPEVPPPPAPPAVGRSMVMAVTNMVPEGKTVDIVVQSLCAGVESDGEDATLKVDGEAIQTRPTKEGEVSFRWVAAGVGNRMVCVEIPASMTCPYPGSVCRQVKVVTYLPEVKEQVAEELTEYESELYKLRKLREIERERLRGVAVSPGTVRIPPSLAGSTVVIEGVPRVVPPEGITVTVPAGENIVTIIREGVREVVPVPVLPGETKTLRGY